MGLNNSVAMQNAVPEVKAVANVVTPMTSDEEAVAWAIEKICTEGELKYGLFDRLFGKIEEPKIERCR